MNKIKLRRNLTILALSIMLYAAYEHFSGYEEGYEILAEDEGAYGKYDDGLIYIGDREYIKELINNVAEGDVLVIDKRLTNDPDMQIIDSYRITDEDDIKDILNCLLEYENNNPTTWNRTLSSMVTEWKVHNFLYSVNYKRYRTDDVDLNNEDENLYNSIILKKLFLEK